ncbi:hypothetical protein K2Y00_00285 [Patescibacteria group bacterium]|nr:hypothetical protein [Patescibacteria group bacterium]
MKTLILGAFVAASVVALPAATYAAMYAYVNVAGEVMTTDATNADQALKTAPNLHVRSGVMLVSGADDSAIIGDDVPGT